MNNAITAFALIKNRSDFQGRTDKYSAVATTPVRNGSINEAINGFGPFDVSRALFDDRQREMAVKRLERYREGWRWYRGLHHDNPYYDGEKKPVFNYCQTVCNKAVEFFVARGWNVKMTRGNEQVAEALDAIWEANHKRLLTQILGQYGTITGDAFLYVTVISTDRQGNLLPKSKWKVGLLPLNPSYCFPTFDATGKVDKILIQYPSNKDPLSTSLYSVVITNDTFQTFKDDSPVTPLLKNPFGRVNVVHFRNLPLAYSNYGVSDIEQVIPYNQSYNNVCFAIERIIRYHSEPTTIVQGARASALEKGANKVWSGIPVDGKVYNLEMKGDLAAIKTYLDELKTAICETSCTPKVVLDGSDMPKSNTAGVALELMFKPILDKTTRRRDGFAPAFKEVNELIMIAHRDILQDPLESLADDPDRLDISSINWTSAMPRDELAELNIAKLKKELKLISQAELLRQFQESEDSEGLALELAADEMHDLALACETGKAEQGLPPVLSCAFIGSPYLNEDLESVAKQISALDNKHPVSE